MGEFEEGKNINDFANEIEEKLNTSCKILPFGKKKVKKVGVVSGGAAKIVNEAVEKVDVFVTGEPSHEVYHTAKEAKVNVIFAGHYATETLGVKALANVLENEFGLDLSGWKLSDVTGISDDGLTLVGCGRNPSQHAEGWIATIPEPATLLIFGLGAVILVENLEMAQHGKSTLLSSSKNVTNILILWLDLN